MEAGEIQRIFDATFASMNVRLLGGSREPVYEPGSPAIIRFKEDFAASALHEVAHWCIAGRRRRDAVDYGYWYEPERDGEVQARFEVVEAPAQALEWIFSVASGRRFLVSYDNFTLPPARREAFRARVRCAVGDRLERGLPPRARRFADALAGVSGCRHYGCSSHYQALPA